MTGQLTVVPESEPIEKHTHLIFHLSGGSQLRYIDTRRFGRFWLLRKGEADTVTGQNKLGLEPTDPAITGEYLKTLLGKRKKTVKEMLLDQAVIAGIGNIYSDEILFAAKIYPGTACRILNEYDWDKLAKKIPEIIIWGIESNNMTPDEYLRGKGKEYRNISQLRIYGRAGKPCVRCGTIIDKVTICAEPAAIVHHAKSHGHDEDNKRLRGGNKVPPRSLCLEYLFRVLYSEHLQSLYLASLLKVFVQSLCSKSLFTQFTQLFYFFFLPTAAETDTTQAAAESASAETIMPLSPVAGEFSVFTVSGAFVTESSVTDACASV